MMTQRTAKIYFPIKFLLAWLVFTILVFSFGPYRYIINNSFKLYSYLVIVNIALYAGYVIGQRSYGRDLMIKIDNLRFVEEAIIISLFYSLFKIFLTLGGDLKNFNDTFVNASRSYLNSSVKHSNLFSYLDIFFAPVTFIAITNTIFNYKKLKRQYRYSVYLIIVFSIGSSIGSATRSGIVQLVIICLAAFLLGIYKKNIVLKSYHKALLILLAILVIIGFLSYSKLLMHTRGGMIVVNPLTYEMADKNFFLFKVTSPELHPVINNISFYISHSYYRLSQALELPFKGIGLGLSNSYFVMDNIESITGSSWLKDISYGNRLDQSLGRGYGLYWSTFYTWIASDFTFPGTVVVIFFMGYFLSLALRDSLYNPTPFSIAAFCSLFYFIFHFSFNNPLQDGAGLTTFFFLPLIWILLRKKYRVVEYK